jgi:hypothetical protein
MIYVLTGGRESGKMKIVTNDYGCGTSSSILDYNIKDVVIVSEDNYDHVYDTDDDLFFIGHDFLFYLWDTKEKIERWKLHKHRKAVWCFERVDAIVPAWKEKGEYSLSLLNQFVDQVYVCDEDDVNTYGDWFPQWGSRVFFDKRDNAICNDKILFSGQAGKPEYSIRNLLLNNIYLDNDINNIIQITNLSRNYSWNDYCENLLSYSAVLNPVGILKGFNTRAYEVMYSGRNLFQQTLGKYERHSKIVKDYPNIVTFQDFDDLKRNINLRAAVDSSTFFEENNIYARFKNIGVKIK